MKECTTSGLMLLREAIIEQAVKDWIYNCKKQRQGEPAQFRELIRFFENDCYGLLMDVKYSGKDILGRLYEVKGAPERNKKA